MNASITFFESMPPGPNPEVFSIIITNGYTTYFRIVGNNLDQIVNVAWYPSSQMPITFSIRQVVLVNPNLGTFGITVDNNILEKCDRGGVISFRNLDGTTFTFPAMTYGSLGKIFTPINQGLITG